MSKLTNCAAKCLQVVLLLVLQRVLHFTEIEIFSSPSLENVQHIQAGGLEVRCWVVRLGDEQLGLGARVDGGEHVTDLQELLLDVLDIFKRGTGEDFDFSKVKHTLEDQE
jgi:hypothetical protein